MDQEKTIENIKILPEIIVKKILFHYIINYLQENKKQIAAKNLINFIKYQDFKFTCLYFDRFAVNGYIHFLQQDMFYIKKKFPNVSFNSLSNNKYMRTMLIYVWKRIKFYYSKFRVLPGPMEQHNIYIAGGFFTNYRFNNIFNTEFNKHFQKFLEKKDIDIYYTNNRSPYYEYNNDFIRIKEYLYNINLIVYRNNFENTVLNTFDFDCCEY
jgi:hypothetical protein